MADQHDTDWALRRLAHADPCPPATAVPTDASVAQALLQEIMMSETPSAGGPQPAFPPPATPSIPTELPPLPGWYVAGEPPAAVRRRRSRVVLVGTGLAVAAAGAGALVLVGGEGGPSAAAEVQQMALASTTAVETDAVQVSATFEFGEARGSARFTAVGGDTAVLLTLDETDGLPAMFPGIGSLEVRVVDGVTYVNTGDDGWQRFDDAAAWPGRGMELEELRPSDLTDAFEQLTELIDAERVGEETVDGELLTHYRGVLDADPGELFVLPGMGPILEPVEFDVDLYVDADELLRRVSAEGVIEANGPLDAMGEVSVDAVIEYGGDLAIEAPADATVVELPEWTPGPGSAEEWPVPGPGGSLPEGWFDESFDLDLGSFAEVMATIAEVQERRPGLCLDSLPMGPGVMGPWATDGAGPDGARMFDELAELFAPVAECFRAEGETEAADAVETALAELTSALDESAPTTTTG